MNQFLGLESTTFEQMTGSVLAEHYHDKNNRALGNQMKKKKNCEKVNPKLKQLHNTAASAQCHGGPLTSATLKNHSFDFCVPHHAYTGVTVWLLKTKALAL